MCRTSTHEPRRPWVVVLAGGDGLRLMGAVVGGETLDRPKQFCSFGQPDSLLRRTLRRAEQLTDRSRIIAVVRHDHRHWWRVDLGRLPGDNVLAQVDNRGTAVAILHALAHVLERESNPILVFLPSDHAVQDEGVLVESIGTAARLAKEDFECLLLLGMAAEYPETEYGWIVPAGPGTGSIRPVSQFVEKPSPGRAQKLMGAGALWNSFVVAASGHALLEVLEGAQPLLFRRYFESFLARSMGKAMGDGSFRALPCVDFGRDILQNAVGRLHVFEVPRCGWTDLGTQRRVNRWLAADEVGARELLGA